MKGWKIDIDKKKPDITYFLNTPFIDYLEDLRKINICPEARTFYEQAYYEHPDYTLEKIIDAYNPTQSWATSMLLVYDGQLDIGVRKKFFSFIKDDMTNYSLWKRLKNISSEEKNVLRDSFRGKLPNVEKRLI